MAVLPTWWPSSLGGGPTVVPASSIGGFNDPGAEGAVSSIDDNAPGGGSAAAGGAGGGGLTAALSGAAKAFGGAQQDASKGPGASPNVGGTAQVVAGRGGQLQALLQALMARQQALMPQGAGTAQKMNQPGLLGL